MEDIALRISNVSKTFKLDRPRGISGMVQSYNDHKTLKALDDISFTVSKGEKIWNNRS